MKIKNYYGFINEDLKSDIDDKLESKNKDLKSAIVKKILDSIKTDEKEDFDKFIDEFIKSDSKNKIIGLINDSDIYEFYLSYRNEIDELLSDINFYDETPSELNVFSLYDYLVKGTQRAIEESVLIIKEETSKSQSSSEASEE